MLQLSTTHQKILQIALPMTFASATIPLLGLVDTAILGHLHHPQYLAAVAVGGSIMTFIGWLFAFLRMGNTGLTAQALGSNNAGRNVEIMAQSLLLGVVLGLILILCHKPILSLAIHLMQPSKNTQSLAFDYCQIRIFAAPATLGTSAVLGWLLGNQKARYCLLILLVTNITNIGLDFWLVIKLQMNSSGAAWASFSAEWLGFCLALLLVNTHLKQLPTTKLMTGLFNPKNYKPLFIINQHLFIRTCCIVFTLAFFYAQGARQGDNILAANAILIQLLLLVAYTQDGFAHAAESMVGHALGSNQLSSFYQVSKLITRWGLTLALVATILLWAFSEPVINLFTNIDAVKDSLHRYWFWLVLLPIASYYCFMADGIFIGANKSLAMLITTLIATFGIFLPVWVITKKLDNDGLWLSYLMFLAARSLLMGWMFFYTSKKNRWL